MAAKPAKKSPWSADVVQRLALARALAKEQGRTADGYTPSPTLPEAKIARFEKTNGISLPDDYRDFLLKVGESGVGPDYGIAPLAPFAPTAMPSVTVTVKRKGGKTTGSAGTGPRPALARAAEMKRPFSLEGTYTPVSADGDIVAPPLPAGAHLYDGCLELGEIGCGYAYLLIVTGPRRGEVWLDTTAALGDGVLAPLAPFRAWLDEWLDTELARLSEALAFGLASAERPAKARAALGAARANVEDVASRVPELRSCAGHVRLALGDRKGALATLAELESADGTASATVMLREAIYSKEIADAGKKGTASLAKHGAREVRLALAANPKVPASLVATLAKDTDTEVRALAARHPNAAPTLVATIAKDGLAAVARGELGLQVALSIELALRNANAQAALVDAAIDAAEEKDDRFAAVILRGAALSKACSQKQRARLASSRWPEVRHAVACSREAGADLVRVLASDPDRAVRTAVAARRDLSPKLLEQLAGDEEKYVRDAVAANPHTPPECLARLALDPSHHFYGRNNPNATAQLIAAFELLRDFDHDDREVDENDAKTVRAWVDEEDVDNVVSTVPAADVVASRKVRHWSFPVAALPAFMGDHMASYNMAGRPWLSAELFPLLAKDSYHHARMNLAERKDTPIVIVDRLAHDASPLARRGAASNPKLPMKTLLVLVADTDEGVREEAAQNPALPPEHLETLARDKVAYVRRGVARSPNVSVALLARLAKDRSEDVRCWVAWAPAMTRAALDVLAKDKDGQTRGRVAFRRAVEKLLAR